LRTITALLTLAACGTQQPVGEGVQPGESVPDAGLTLDTNMTQGHTRADHVEVADGVFLLADLANSGQYRAISSGGGTSTTTGTGYTGYTGYTTYTGYTGYTPSCFNFDYGTNGDEIDDSQLFGGWLAWNGWAQASSFDDGTQVYNQIFPNAWASVDLDEVDGIGAIQYLWLNDEYIGFAEEHLTDEQMALTVTFLEVPCDEGYLDFSTFNTMYIRAGDSAIEVNNRTDAYVVCCPE
jgi:hypothetical protein